MLVSFRNYVPLAFIILATLLLGGLGVWQVERLAWKNSIIADIAAKQAMPVLGTLPQDASGLEYRKVLLTGTFLHDKAFHLIGRQEGNSVGYFIVTPFSLEDDGRVILVNRGFAPLNKESKPAGLQTVAGIVRPARLKRFFAPNNVPQKNVWFYEDMNAMSQASGIALTPFIVEATGKEEAGVFPIPADGTVSLRNDHLGYAITWFSLAAVGLVMFWFYRRAGKTT